MSGDLAINWDNIVTLTDADLQACYDLGFLAYPTFRPIGTWLGADAMQMSWEEGWADAKDLKDCEHFDLSRQRTAVGMTI
jgi:hypothetical protein